MIHRACWIFVLMAGCIARGDACPYDLPVHKARVNGQVISLEVATTESERKCGLSGRDALPMDRGMLFVLPRRMPVDFWMNDMKIPLAIAFLDRNMNIVDIQTMDPAHPHKHYYSPGPIDFVVEVNQDWFALHEVKVGNVIYFLGL